MGMTIEDLKKECKYCCLEIDNSGLEGFRCTNKTVIKTTDSSWCYPKNADEPCSICEYCEPKKEEIKMTIDEALEHGKEQLEIFGGEHKEFIETSIDTMRKHQQLQADYENRLKADMVAMLEEIQLEIDEMPMHYDPRDVSNLIQQKINALRGNADG